MAFGIDDAIAAGLSLINKFVPDADARAKAEAEWRVALLGLDAAQAATNTAEAQSSDKFTSRWRPFIGWVCGISFAYHFVVQPVLLFFAALSGATIALPSFPMDTLMTVLMGILGLGTLRTYEKMKGISQ